MRVEPNPTESSASAAAPSGVRGASALLRGARAARGEEAGTEFSALLMGALWSGANGAFGSAGAQSLPRTAQGSRDAGGTGSQSSLASEAPRSPTTRARVELATGSRVGPSAAAEMSQSAGETQPANGVARRGQASVPIAAGGSREMVTSGVSMQQRVASVQAGATSAATMSAPLRAAGIVAGSGQAASGVPRATVAPQVAASSSAAIAGVARAAAVRPVVSAMSAPGAGSRGAGAPAAPGSSVRLQRVNQSAPGAGQLSQQESAEFLSSVERGFAALLSRQGGRVTLRLAPESLGRMTIQLDVKQGVVKADFAVEHRAAREELDRALPTLRASLEARGLSVARLDVRTMESPQVADRSSDASALQAASRGASMVALVRPSLREGARESHVSAEDPRHPSEWRRTRGSRMLHDAVDLVA